MCVGSDSHLSLQPVNKRFDLTTCTCKFSQPTERSESRGAGSQLMFGSEGSTWRGARSCRDGGSPPPGTRCQFIAGTRSREKQIYSSPRSSCASLFDSCISLKPCSHGGGDGNSTQGGPRLDLEDQKLVHVGVFAPIPHLHDPLTPESRTNLFFFFFSFFLPRRPIL